MCGVYDAVGIYFLVKDHDVVKSCHASNPAVHVIWEIDLWSYVLTSIVLFTACLGIMFMVPIRKGFRHLQRHGKKSRRGSSAAILRWGLMDNLPDWLFLMHGIVFLMFSMAFGIVAYIGYFELFVSRRWCENKTAAFEELDLWHFGRVTFFLQVICSIYFFLWGLSWWSVAFVLELTEPEMEQSPLLTSSDRP